MKNLFLLSFLLFTITTNIFSVSAETNEIATFDESVNLPILMYHFLTESPQNRWAITPKTFEEDLMYLKAHGYETIFMSDAINYVYEGKKLPDKPIVLTFDDGDSSVHHTALPLLKKYDMKAVVAIIGKPTDEYSNQDREDIQYYPNLTWKQVKELCDSGLIEIQNHSYDLHHGNGAKKKRSEPNEEYNKRLSEDLNKLQEKIKEEIGTTPNTFVYPFGAISNDSIPILKENGFLASLSCAELVSPIRLGDASSLYSLGRFLRPQDLTPDVVFKMLKND